MYAPPDIEILCFSMADPAGLKYNVMFMDDSVVNQFVQIVVGSS